MEDQEIRVHNASKEFYIYTIYLGDVVETTRSGENILVGKMGHFTEFGLSQCFNYGYNSCYHRRVMSSPSPSLCWLAACRYMCMNGFRSGMCSNECCHCEGMFLLQRNFSVAEQEAKTQISGIIKHQDIMHIRCNILFCLAALHRCLGKITKNPTLTVSPPPSFRCKPNCRPSLVIITRFGMTSLRPSVT